MHAQEPRSIGSIPPNCRCTYTNWAGNWQKGTYSSRKQKKNTSMPLQYLQASEKHCGLPSSVSEGFRETNPGSRCQQSLLMLDLEFSTRSGSSAQTSQTSVVISCHRVRACCLFYPCHHSFANIASLNPHHDRISNIFLLKRFL